MKEIVQKESPVLRNKASEVPRHEITSAKIQDVIKNMSAALATQDDGVALAAPQINESLRIFVVSGSIFESDVNPKTMDDLVFINPEIVELGSECEQMEEGCLSVRGSYGKVDRARNVTMRARNKAGKEFTMRGTGLLAQIFQHEYDHLDGILFIDKATDLRQEHE